MEWCTQKENCADHGKDISHPRRVIQKDLQGNVIKTFDSLIEAGKAINLSASSISKAVLKKNNTAGGFVWDYEGVHTEELDITKGKPIYGHKKYLIFPDGTVYNIVRKAKVKPIENAAGYFYVTISNNDTKKNHYIQRLVADHFPKKEIKSKTEIKKEIII